jgi:hypothetical protein
MEPRDLNKCSKALRRVLANGRRPVGIYLTNDQINEIVNKNRVHSDGIWFLIGKTKVDEKPRRTVELIPFEFDENKLLKVTRRGSFEGKLETTYENILNNDTDPNFAIEKAAETKEAAEPNDVAIYIGTIPGQRTPPPKTF